MAEDEHPPLCHKVSHFAIDFYTYDCVHVNPNDLVQLNCYVAFSYTSLVFQVCGCVYVLELSSFAPVFRFQAQTYQIRCFCLCQTYLPE